MKKNIYRIGLPALFVCLGVLLSTVFIIGADESENVNYPINDNGQTYGSMPADVNAKSPDLICAYGIDYTEGYVLRSDIEGTTGPLKKPTNHEEVLQYMEQVEELLADARARGDEYLYYIPLYASDGRTIIGQFGISIPVINENVN